MPGPLFILFFRIDKREIPREAPAPAKATVYTFHSPGDKGSVHHEKHARDNHK